MTDKEFSGNQAQSKSSKPARSAKNVRDRLCAAIQPLFGRKLAIELLENRTMLSATAGTLDSTFGSGGLVNSTSTDEQVGNAVAVQSGTGDIVVAGSDNGTFSVSVYSPTGTQIAQAITPIGTSSVSQANAVTIDANGNIVAAGYATDAVTQNDFVAARYTLSGNTLTLDTTFGSNHSGYVATDIGGNKADIAESVTVDNALGGDILVAGVTALGTSTPHDAVVAYTSGGVLDTGHFGGGTGKLVVTGGSADSANAVAVDSNGQIVIAGQSPLTGNTKAEVVIINSSGTTDTRYTPIVGTSGDATSVAVASNGDYLIGGTADNNFVLAAISPSGPNQGKLDTSFNSAGTTPGEIETAFSGNGAQANAIAIQANNKIVLAGSANNASSDAEFALARYNANGTPDTAFGTAGTVTGTVTSSSINGVAIEPDGKIVAAGTTSGANDAITVARYVANNAPVVANDASIDEIDKNQTNSTGNTVATIVGRLNETDADNDALGIAITGVDDTHGTWQYSTDGGGTFAAIPTTLSDSSALLLAKTTGTKNNVIRFVPNTNFTGTATLSLRGWDETQGANNTTYSATASAAANLNAFSDATHTLTQTVAPYVSTVYVDAAWAGSAQDQQVTDSHGTHTFGIDAFATIQDGVTYVASGGTVNVDAGTYTEDVTINQPLKLLGPNASTNPNTGSRAGEAIIEPATSDPNPNDSGFVQVIYDYASNVTIEGFTINGANPSLASDPSAVNVNGTEVNAGEAISSYEGVGGINIQNNIVENTSYAGLDFDNFANQGAATTDNTISNNKISNIGYDGYLSSAAGIGVLIYNNFYASITSNTISGAYVGVQTGNFDQANPDSNFTPAISNNTISVSGVGIFYNLSYGNTSAFTIANNAITAVDADPAQLAQSTEFDAIEISSQQSAVSLILSGNQITVPSNLNETSVGYQIWNDPTTNTVTINGGSVSGANYGVWVNNYDGYSSPGESTAVNISGVSISNSSTAGVYVQDDPRAGNGSTISANITNGTSITGGPTGIAVSGANASIAFSGTNPASLTGQSGDYITLSNGAESGQTIDATGVSFDGNTGSTATTAQDYAIEDKITDAIDASGLGFVRIKNGNVFVTPNSYSSANGTTTPSIQRGVNAASAGDTVNVENGTYVGQVSITKNLTLAGQSQAGVIVQADGNLASTFSTGSGAKDPIVSVQNANVTIQNLSVDGNSQGNAYGDGFIGVAFDNASGTLNNVTIENVENSPFNGVQNGVAFYAYDANNSTQNVTVTNDTINSYQKNGMVLAGAGLSFDVANDTVTGAGSTTQIGQNGIEVADDATGTIANNSVSGNEYSGQYGGPDLFNDTQAVGILLLGTTGVQITGNTIDGSDIGIYNNSDNATIANNQLGSTTANRYAGIVEDQGSSTITGNTITGGNVGVYAFSYDGETGESSSATVSGNTISGAGVGLKGISQSSTDPAVAINAQNNTFSNDTTGILIDSGATLTVGSGNTISGGTTGLELDGATAALAGNTLNNLSFTGQTGNYITLADGAESGQTIDATGVSFDGKTGTTATTAQDFAIEDKITDALDTTGVGYVNIKSGSVFVTPTSGAGAISRGVAVALAGNTVYVEAGTYSDNVTINKAITLDGAQAGVSGASASGTSPTRTASGESDVVTHGNQTAVFTIASAGVTIDGFTIDGDDPTVSGATLTSGNDANAVYGVRAALPYSNLNIEDNVIKNVEIGFRGDGTSSAATSNNSISQNWFDSIGVYDFGYAVNLRTNFYANVSNNLMTRVQSGIQTNNFSGNIGPSSWAFAGNTISAYGAGIWDNLQHNHASPLSIDGNTITSLAVPNIAANSAALANSSGHTIGILLVSIQDAVSVSLTNNNISGMAYGITAFNTTTASTITPAASNTITGNGVGVYLTNIVQYNPVTTTVLGGSTNNPSGTGSLNLTGLTLAGNTTGVLVNASNPSSAYGVSLTVGSGDSITGGTTGLAVSGATASIAGNTLGNLSFSGQSGDYITLSNGAESGQTIDATGVSFDGNTGSTATTAQDYAIEDKITDAIDASGLGFVRIKNGNVFVTPNSYSSANGTTTPSIQRGVDAASAGDTVNVEAGTYPGVVNVNKQLKLEGAQAGTSAAGRSGGESVIQSPTSGSTAGDTELEISASDVTVDGFTIHGNTNGNVFGTGIYITPATAGTQILNNIVQNNIVGLIIANASTTDQAVVSGNLFQNNTNAGPAAGQDIYADNSTTGGTLSDVLIQNNSFTNSSPTENSWALGIGNTGPTSFTNINFENNQVSNSGRGVYYYGTNGATISGNTFDGASHYAVGLFGSNGTPANSNVSVTGNTFTNDAKGIELADDTSAAAVSGTLTLTGNTFANSTATYIDNESAASFDASNNTFGGYTPTASNLAQQYALADRIVDGVDVSGFGLVDIDPTHHNVYVTPNSFFTPDGTTTPSIQRGVDAASAGDTVNVENGTYVGQVSITKNLTLAGQSQAGVIVQADGNLASTFSTGSGAKDPIVSVSNNANVTVQNLSVDGNSQGNAYGDGFIGVAFDNASGTLNNVTIENVENAPFNGVQNGVAFYAYDSNNSTQSVTVTNDTLTSYQKNGMVLAGAGLSFDVANDTVTGAGSTTQIGQNGIEVADDATGTIANNTISGNEYSGTGSGADQFNDTQAAGILLFNTSNLQVTGNTIDGNDIGIYNNTDNATISNNQLGNTTANRYEGIVEDQGSATISNNTIKGGDLGVDVVTYDGETGESSSANLSGNTITGATIGVEAVVQSTGDPAVSVTVYRNTISNSGTGLKVDSGAALTSASQNYFTDNTTGIDIAAGAASVGPINVNSISGNTSAGLENDSALTVDATQNWWGSANGPKTPLNTFDGANTTGDKVIGTNVAISPWLTDGTDADPTTPGFQHALASSAAPDAPSTPQLSSTDDSGASNSDGVTNVNTPHFSGTSSAADAGDTITLYDTDGTTVLGSTTAASDGSWTVQTSALADGKHTITAVATDHFGVESSASSAATVYIDTQTPTGTITDNSTAHVAGTPVNLAGSYTQSAALPAGSTPTFMWSVTASNGQVIASATTQNFNFTPNDQGTYTVNFVVTDRAGNSSTTTTDVITIADATPVASISSAPPSNTAGTPINLTGTATDAGTADNAAGYTFSYTVSKNGVAGFASGTSTAGAQSEPITFTPDDQGTYVVTLTAKDHNGVTSAPTTETITVGDATPVASISSAPSSNTAGTTINLTGTATDAGTADNAAGYTFSYTVSKNGVAGFASGSSTAGAQSEPITFTPDDQGTYVVTLTATDHNGVTSAPTTETITVGDATPVASISPAPPSNTAGTPIDLTGTATDAGTADNAAGYTFSYTVSKNGVAGFASGTSSAGAQSEPITFTPDDQGTYVVTLTAKDHNGVTSAPTTETITVGDATPVASISPAPTTNTAGTAINLTGTAFDAGTADNAAGYTFAYNITKNGVAFASGTSAAGAQSEPIVFTPDDAGTYVVTLTATDHNSVSSTPATETITVGDATPVASISQAPATNTAGTAINLTGTATDAGTADNAAGYTFAYNITKNGVAFASGTSTAGAQSEPITFTPDDQGTYVVTLTAKDHNGVTSAPTTETITVGDATPVASISQAPASNTAGTTINLTGTATDAGTADNAAGYTFSYTVSKNGVAGFASGSSAAGAQSEPITFTPDDAGTYVVTLTAMDHNGVTSTPTTETITVGDATPVASISAAPSSNTAGTQISLTGTATDAGTADNAAGYTFAYNITKNGVAFASGTSTAGSSSEPIVFTPDDQGTYVVTLTATDHNSVTSTAATETITVGDATPVASISQAPASNPAGTPINLTGTATDAGTADNAAGYTFSYTVSKNGVAGFASGSSTAGAQSEQITFTPDDQGTYVVTLTATDHNGVSGTTSETITVSNVAPTASITGAPSNSPEGTTISVTGNVTDPGSADTETYVWSVTKNGNAYTSQTDGPTQSRTDGFSFTPNTNGTYVLSLVVTDSHGASSNTATQTITVTDVAPTVALSGSKSDSSNPTPNDAEGSTFTLTLGPVVDPGYAGGERVQDYYINWGDNSAIQTVTAAQLNQTTGGTITHVYADGTVVPGTTTPTDTIHVDILDNNGYHGDAGTLGVVVYNLPPTASFGGSASVSEGTSANITFFNQSDPSTTDAAAGYTYSYDFNNDGIFEVTNSSSPNVTVPASYLSTPGTVTVRGRIIDKDGGYTDYTHQIVVNNVAPTVNALSNVTTNQGSAFAEMGSFTDPGADSPWQVYANYNYNASTNSGRGTLIQSSASKSFTLGNTYNTPGTYTVLVTVVDNQGASGTGSFTVTVGSTGFAVSSFTPTPSGFDVVFNRALNTSALNLYKGLSGTYGTSDLTLTGPNGPIHGSFVYDPTTFTGHFIATGGVLPVGSYSATLVGSTSAFQDASGNALQSNDGTGNYDASFNITSVGDVVSTSDFARGPGQNINLPATSTAGVPITIADGTNVTAVDFDLLYNANDLNISSINLGSSLPSGWAVVTNGSTPGDLRVSVYGTTALSSGKQTILNLLASVPSAATYGNAADLQIVNLRINEGGIAGTGDDAVEKVAFLGDASGNKGYSAYDAALIANVVVGNATGFDAYPLVDPVIVGDVTGDGTLSGLDASLVAQQSVGLSVSQIPAIPAGTQTTAPATGLDPTVTIGSIAPANPGTTIVIPVSISDDNGLLGANFSIGFNASQLQFVSATVGSVDGNFAVYTNADNTGGTLQLGLQDNGMALSGGSGTIAYLTFTVPAAAPTGSNAVTIAGSDGGLNEGGLPLSTVNGSVDVENATVNSESIFYYGSKWDNSDATPNISTDYGAVATDKTALLPGQTASFANYTSYTSGINGILVDFGNLAAGTVLTANDFKFAVGNTATPSSWATGPAPVSVTMGTHNGDVVADIVWANNAIQNEWLQVTVLAGGNAHVASNTVFYYGNLIGSTGVAGSISNGRVKVTTADVSATQAKVSPIATTITSNFDFDRDKKVTTADVTLVQNHVSPITNLLLFTAPATPTSATVFNSSTAVFTSSTLVPTKISLGGLSGTAAGTAPILVLANPPAPKAPVTIPVAKSPVAAKPVPVTKPAPVTKPVVVKPATVAKPVAGPKASVTPVATASSLFSTMVIDSSFLATPEPLKTSASVLKSAK